MTALKHFPEVQESLASTPLAESKLWTQNVESIIPAQLVAYQARAKLDGRDATPEILTLMRVVAGLLDAGKVAHAPMLECNLHEPPETCDTFAKISLG